jgi:acyl carrier protein
MEEKIIRILNKIHPGINYANEETIFTGQNLDSLEFAEFISSLEDEFELIIDFDNLEMKNFDSIELIKKAIEQ